MAITPGRGASNRTSLELKLSLNVEHWRKKPSNRTSLELKPVRLSHLGIPC